VNDNFSADTVASLLAEVWPLHKGGGFAKYLAETCGRSISGQASFDCIYITQAEEGDIPNAVLRSAVRWWKVDDSGIKSTRRPDLPAEPDALENVREGFYIMPVIRFFKHGGDVLIGESYGPHLFSRKVGVLITVDGRLTLTDVRVILTYDML
jgi:hypothetical protein